MTPRPLEYEHPETAQPRPSRALLLATGAWGIWLIAGLGWDMLVDPQRWLQAPGMLTARVAIVAAAAVLLWLSVGRRRAGATKLVLACQWVILFVLLLVGLSLATSAVFKAERAVVVIVILSWTLLPAAFLILSILAFRRWLAVLEWHREA